MAYRLLASEAEPWRGLLSDTETSSQLVPEPLGSVVLETSGCLRQAQVSGVSLGDPGMHHGGGL